MPKLNPLGPHLRWQRAEDGSRDYTAREGQGYCRTYKVDAGPMAGRWYWTASDGHNDLGTGYAVSAVSACLLAEAALWGLKGGDGRLKPVEPDAKGRGLTWWVGNEFHWRHPD